MNSSQSSALQPTQLQILMLKAALGDEPQTRTAWHSLRSQIDLQTLDAWANDLLSLIFRNLSQHHIDDPELERLKGIYRHHWVDTQLALSQTVDMVTALEAAHVSTLLLESAPLAERYYADRGVRYTAVDVLVPTLQRDQALAVLRTLGWTFNQRRSPSVATAAATQLEHQSSGRCATLHWHVLADSCNLTGDQDFWAARVPFSLNNVQTTMLNPADELLRICVNSARHNPALTIRWLADVYKIIETTPDIDWGRVIEAANKRNFTLAVSEALQTLRAVFELSVLDDVLQRLNTLPISQAELRDQQIRHQTHEVRGLRFYLQEYYRLRLHSTAPAENLPLLDYLTQRLGLSHRYQLAGYFSRRLARRFKRKFSSTT